MVGAVLRRSLDGLVPRCAVDRGLLADGTAAADLPFEFPDLFSAIEEAKHVLAEMALDGLPSAPERRLSIEVQNSERLPIVSLQLELKISYLPQARN